MQIASVQDLCVRYEAADVFKDVSFSVKKADYIALVGPNGSGKSTLIKSLIGIVKPTSGTVSVFDAALPRFQEWYKIGYVPQRLTSLDARFPATVQEVVAMGLLSRKAFPKRTGKTDRIVVEKALSMMDITGLRDRRIGELSGGQQQRALIARALVHEPEFLILDEPATALDPETRERFFGILSELNQQKHMTIMLVTHDIGSAGKYASTLLYFDRGVVFYGTFKQFCESQSMGNFFGESAQHVICHQESCRFRKGLGACHGAV